MRVEPRSYGFSLVELVVSLLLLSLILGSLGTVVVTMQRSFTRQQTTLRSQEALRAGEMIIANILRTARADPNDTGGGLLDPDPFNDGVFRSLRARADFNPPDRDFDDPLEDVTVGVSNDTLYVIWQSGGPIQPLAHPVDSLRFEYFNDAGTALTTDAEVSGATKVRLTLVAAEDPLSGSVERRVSWIYLRNR